MSAAIIGLDIGGANLKAFHTANVARSLAFALWKQPDKLSDALRALLAPVPAASAFAITMTGEQCDCYPSQQAGVRAILASVRDVVGTTSTRVWSKSGGFLDLREADQFTQLVGAANWHALATWCGQTWPHGNTLLLDIGSTTTDVIPIEHGKPATRGLHDSDRLVQRELVYTGVRRTPLCALLQRGTASEWFATSLDVYLILGEIGEDANDCDTADQRPALAANAHARLARSICADLESSSPAERVALAVQAKAMQLSQIEAALRHVRSCWGADPETVILSGSGEFLGKQVLRQLGWRSRVISLSDTLGLAHSTSACARAVALLAS